MEEIERVFEEYGADTQVLDEYDCVPLRARIVRDVIKLRTSLGTRAFKKVFTGEERLRYVHSALEHAFSRGVANVPRFIRNRYGDAFVQHTSGTYYLTAWISGREADFRKLPEFLAGARLLAEWHEAMNPFLPSGIPVPVIRTTKERVAGAIRDFTAAKAAALSTTTPSPFQRLLMASADEIEARCNTALDTMQSSGLDAAERAARTRGWVCHGNFHRQNVLFDGERFSVLHYDGVHPGLPITDLAFLCHRYMPTFDWDASVFMDVWNAYQGDGRGTVEDIRYMDALLSLPLRTLQVVSWYHRDTKEWDEDDYLDYLEACLSVEESREYARKSLQLLIERSDYSAHRAPPVDLQGDWTVATFTLDQNVNQAVQTPLVPNVIQSEAYDALPPVADSPSANELPSSHDAANRQPTQPPTGRKKRRRQRRSTAFQPAVPGLRLWSPNKHHGKDNEEQ